MLHFKMGYSSHSFFPDKGITSTPSPTFLSRQPLTVSGPNLRQEVKKAGNSLQRRETQRPSIVYVNFSQYWFEERGQWHVVVSKESRIQERSNIICISEMVGLYSIQKEYWNLTVNPFGLFVLLLFVLLL